MRGAGDAALAPGRPPLTAALGTPEDLRYEGLELEVTGDVVGALDVEAHACGSHPNFQRGRRVVGNVDVAAPAQSLLRAGRAAYRVPVGIEGRSFDRGKE